MKGTFLPLLLSTTTPLLSTISTAQCTVQSTTGYTVFIDVKPVAIHPSTTNCPWGYNYTTQLAYDISLSSNAPTNALNTLQGTIACNGTSQFFDLPNGPGVGMTSSANTWMGMTNCNTANPVNMNCLTLRIEIGGVGISSRTITCATTPVVLPVELLAFTAQANTRQVDLAWSTASEKDNAFFTVERSADGETFTAVTTVPGAGNSQSVLHYQAVDIAPLPGVAYYRLRQTDHDGAFSLSELAVVHARPSASELLVLPNPVGPDGFRVIGATPDQVLQVRSITGELIHEQSGASAPVMLPEMGRGLHLVHLVPTRGGQTRVVRLVKE